jgi:hypothetical protein
MSKYTQEFLKKRFILESIELNDYVTKAIDILECVDKLVRSSENEKMDTLNKETHWPIMHDMYNRSYEYVCGSLSLLIIGQLQSCEASCRTAIEGAVNLHYISLGDSLGKIISYFKNHIKIELKQNVNWKAAIDSSNVCEADKEYHRRLISNKNDALSNYEAIIKKSMNDAGVDVDKYEAKWPSGYDRFCLIDDEIGYRTVYVALCSQSHNDPEDLLNHLLSRVIGDAGLTSAKKEEQYFFSLDMVLQAIKYHIMASGMYLGKFELSCDELPLEHHKILDLMMLAQKDKHNLLNELTNQN